MRTRLRYIKTDTPGVYTTTQRIISQKTKALYDIRMNIEEMTFRITNVRNGHIVKRNKSKVTNLHVLKRNIKKALKELGVRFDIEIRDRNYGVVQKNEE